MAGLLDGRTVVVSGVGPGLGREVALAAGRDGANVVLGGRTEAKLKAVAAELDRVAYAVTDIVDENACAALVQMAVDAFGGVDAIVHVAAREDGFGTLLDGDFELWRGAFETNVIGTLQLTKAAVPELEKRGGAVVFIGTQAAFQPQLPQPAYAVSKGALLTSMYYLANELGPKKIRVNTVVPTWMWGPQVEAYAQYKADKKGVGIDEVRAGLAKNMPLGEVPEDADVANAAVFFASDRARMVTGQTLFVNAGEYYRS